MRALIFSRFFPCRSFDRRLDDRLAPSLAPAGFANTLTLGIGGNIGDCKKRFEHLWRWLQSNKNISSLRSSPIYRNPAFGYTHQDDFYNATITLATRFSIVQLFGLIFYLERRFGRPKKREFKNSPRTLDIDIIFFNDLILKRPYLKIPHPNWSQRESVLIPLFLTYLTQKGQ
ncbi:2-amino-4-hydroxy-6-hydroxymethyldihydropteridine diphosphokinase [Helicobacter sp. 11S02596-1]|uniref:2-amino-4-hydroxy-6- hydroxymethyldihydropteridine diphosphokinase n=1 Tax=Helicobacter sp. 11S02596-1 TaxID=1476194 RepID=UPI000BA690EA|nr:2-amino-4-hydroxy-6-hydroxymethyldihydropteridine diphosphokinase [Helicobacter sp. 11S02596-1]PAF41933.1 2-amino-4-hydroxy-6-hydroxymethyldihydropteridine diphosphokinase [Helicobacter sp. 11S02596-1]